MQLIDVTLAHCTKDGKPLFMPELQIKNATLSPESFVGLGALTHTAHAILLAVFNVLMKTSCGDSPPELIPCFRQTDPRGRSSNRWVRGMGGGLQSQSLPPLQAVSQAAPCVADQKSCSLTC